MKSPFVVEFIFIIAKQTRIFKIISQNHECQSEKSRPQEIILPTGGVSSLFALLQILDILLCQLTGRFPARCAVWCVQLETEPPFPDLKCQAAVFIIVHQPALGWVLCRILAQTVFKGSVVGTHLNDGACLVKKDASCLLLLGKTCSHKTSVFS